MGQVEQAHVQLHDLEWLQECGLARLPVVAVQVQPNQIMPEAQALRSFLITTGSQAIEDVNRLPGKERVAVFLTGYLAVR